MGVSENDGTPNWMVKIMENPIKMGWFGGKTHYFRKHPYIHPSSLKPSFRVSLTRLFSPFWTRGYRWYDHWGWIDLKTNGGGGLFWVFMVAQDHDPKSNQTCWDLMKWSENGDVSICFICFICMVRHLFGENLLLKTSFLWTINRRCI